MRGRIVPNLFFLWVAGPLGVPCRWLGGSVVVGIDSPCPRSVVLVDRAVGTGFGLVREVNQNNEY